MVRSAGWCSVPRAEERAGDPTKDLRMNTSCEGVTRTICESTRCINNPENFPPKSGPIFGSTGYRLILADVGSSEIRRRIKRRNTKNLKKMSVCQSDPPENAKTHSWGGVVHLSVHGQLEKNRTPISFLCIRAFGFTLRILVRSEGRKGNGMESGCTRGALALNG